MNNESWNKWIPNNNLSKKYYVDEVIDSDELSICLSDDFGKSLSIIWNCIVESYICSEEVNRNRLYSKSEVTEWTFFEVCNSNYINWLIEESDGILNGESLHHICIVGINSVIDVVASDYPKLYILNI